MLKYRIVLIDDDPIFRLGIRSICEQLHQAEIVAEAETITTSLELLKTIKTPDLIILDIAIKSGLSLCQQIKTKYPQTPILILTKLSTPKILRAAKNMGVEGYTPKGTPVSQLNTIIANIIGGKTYWHSELSRPSLDNLSSPIKNIVVYLGTSGIRQIESNLANVKAQLEHSETLVNQEFTSAINRLILQGEQRELLAARWLVSHVLPPEILRELSASNPEINETTIKPEVLENTQKLINNNSQVYRNLSLVQTYNSIDIQAILFDRTIKQLQSDLINHTEIPLEIDILRLTKKRELLYLVLRQIEIAIDTLRHGRLESEILISKKLDILTDIWSSSLELFFGKYYSIPVTTKNQSQNLEIVPILLQNKEEINTAILDKIPLVDDLLNHLIWETPLTIKNTLFTLGTTQAMIHAEYLLQNILISLANAVMQPLLNNFGDREEIKQKFYDSHLLSTREIEKFRNNLTWKYRQYQYWEEPNAIFSSRHELLILNEQGLEKISIYAPRSAELAQLSGIQLAITLMLEARDAAAPRIREIVSFLGRGIIYVLTQIIGRGIGLIGKGIIQGIGYSLQDTRIGRTK